MGVLAKHVLEEVEVMTVRCNVIGGCESLVFDLLGGIFARRRVEIRQVRVGNPGAAAKLGMA